LVLKKYSFTNLGNEKISAWIGLLGNLNICRFTLISEIYILTIIKSSVERKVVSGLGETSVIPDPDFFYPGSNKKGREKIIT
jgi:hypothetical protein